MSTWAISRALATSSRRSSPRARTRNARGPPACWIASDSLDFHLPMSDSTGPGRIALGLEYQGAAYAGWQAQRAPGLPTVQETLETVLARIADRPVATVCAGRTDAGVH